MFLTLFQMEFGEGVRKWQIVIENLNLLDRFISPEAVSKLFFYLTNNANVCPTLSSLESIQPVMSEE